MWVAGLVIMFAIIITIIKLHTPYGADKKCNKENGRVSPSKLPDDVSTWTPEMIAAASPEERRRADQIIHKNITSMAAENFNMPGWNMWDASIHSAPGQFDRIGRATTQKDMQIVFYDPTTKLAKIRGTSATYYLTSSHRCSCQDFRSRRLPCKHMYMLAIALENDPEKRIIDTYGSYLTGLYFCLAGRFSDFPGKTEGVKKYINQHHGIWETTASETCSALIAGNDSGLGKLNFAADHDIEVLNMDTLIKLCEAITTDFKDKSVETNNSETI